MIVLKADSELKMTFERLIKTMHANVNWTGLFVALDNYLILQGEVRSLFFHFDSRKVAENIVDLPIKEDEIKDWLDKCEEKIEGFVILDDGAYEWHRHGFDKHLVKTDFCTGGLREEDADKAIKILNKKRLFSFFKKY